VETQDLGRLAEEHALHYLLQQGLSLVARNYHSRFGEVDLIMRDQEFLVFIEVRSRLSQRFGPALASVNYTKQQKIIKTATYYLIKEKLTDRIPIRFDVLSVDGASNSITWLKAAF
jgi:putative endonuclease